MIDCNKESEEKIKIPVYLLVSIDIDYFIHDAVIQGDMEEPDNIPCRNGKNWEPIIHLSDGQIINWHSGLSASIYSKVRDTGDYWLLNEQKQKIRKWYDNYVPDKFLCIDEKGFGDYLIFTINQDGKIHHWHNRKINNKEWEEIA
jgi:hypothetical protein